MKFENFFFSISINVRFLEKLPLKLNKQHYVCDRQTDRHEKQLKWLCDRRTDIKKNAWECF
jgi:hypothetical protein